MFSDYITTLFSLAADCQILIFISSFSALLITLTLSADIAYAGCRFRLRHIELIYAAGSD